jgi:hypothetical protein
MREKKRKKKKKNDAESNSLSGMGKSESPQVNLEILALVSVGHTSVSSHINIAGWAGKTRDAQDTYFW